MCDVWSVSTCRECGGVVIACSWVHACMYTCADPISASGVFCHVSPTHALRQSLSQYLAFMDLAGLVGLRAWRLLVSDLTWIRGLQSHQQLHGGRRFEFKSSCLHGKHFTNWPSSPTQMCVCVFFFQRDWNLDITRKKETQRRNYEELVSSDWAVAIL